MTGPDDYPPHGIRGVAKFHRGVAYGSDFEEYYLHGHERLLCITQIETDEDGAIVMEVDEAGEDGDVQSLLDDLEREMAKVARR